MDTDVFSTDHAKVACAAKVPPHFIELLPRSRPFHHSPRRTSRKDKEEIERQLAVLQAAGAISPSWSPWASRVLLVPKKNGKRRMCIDYRQLNSMTVKDRYALPRIDDCLSALGGQTFFSTLDCCSGFHSLKLHPATKHYTAFITHCGLYEWNCNPFGMVNYPAGS